MSKVLLKSAFALALALLCAAGARAQRVGPVEDDAGNGAKPPAEKSNGAKPDPKADAKRSDAKPAADAKTSAEAKPAAKNDQRAQGGEEKRDHPTAPAANNSAATSGAATPSAPAPSNTPSTANAPNANNGSSAAVPHGERAASSASTGDPVPDVTPTPVPLHGSPSAGSLPPPPKYEPPQPIKADITPGSSANNGASNNNPSNGNSPALSPTDIYRVGAGDILDIRLVGGMSKDYTLFTVLSNGTIDYPLAGEPLYVLNLTTEEIGARLSATLKRRGIFDRAQFQISVRDYTSHTVLVSGLVEQPGQKVLRREAVPLYVVLTEALQRPDAGRVVIVSRNSGTKTIDLADSGALNELVEPGDVINVQPRPQEFYFIAGQVVAPGQKDYHAGLTLTQAVFAAGGVTREAGRKTVVTVSRQGADGRLIPADYVLQEIQDGKAPDPRVQAGDRIEVGRRR